MSEIRIINLFMQHLIQSGTIQNQEGFGKSLGYNNKSSFSQLLKREKVSDKFRKKLLEVYPVYSEWLKNSQSSTNSEVIENKNGNKFAENTDGSFTITVPLVPFDAYASYVESLESEVAIVSNWEMVSFNVDRIGRGNYLGFKSKGDSMNGGLINDTPDRSLLLGRELGRQHWLDGFNETDYGWIIISKYNMMHKDIIGLDIEKGTIKCHSRNKSPEHQDFDLELNDVYQIFKVIKRTF